jgi:hypothetical protein
VAGHSNFDDSHSSGGQPSLGDRQYFAARPIPFGAWFDAALLCAQTGIQVFS